MKKLILTAVAFASLSSIALAGGERERDMRLDDQTTIDSSSSSSTAPVILLNTFPVEQNSGTTNPFEDSQRLDEKNGYNG
jgi:hypothetical protein